MELKRSKYQGVLNILTFNSHLYISVFCSILLLILLEYFIFKLEHKISLLFALLLFINILTSIFISFIVYDRSGFYELNWLNLNGKYNVLNINAGFDEISTIISEKFQKINLTTADFYDPKIHTELSIKKARNKYPPSPLSKKINSTNINFPDNSFDNILLVMSAHEIRDSMERNLFFQELKRIIKPNGVIYLVEHLRNIPNSLVYTFGVFHFHSKRAWLKNFKSADLTVLELFHHTPFLTIFKLKPNGDSL